MIPTRDPAMCIELGSRATRALMTENDWCELLDRLLYATPSHPENQPTSEAR